MSLGHFNEAILRQAQLVCVLRYVTVRRYAVLRIEPASRSALTQPPTLSGTGSEYRTRKGPVLRGWEGNRRYGVTLAMCHTDSLVYAPADSKT